ncbi:single-stranded-DNA-specific exonuclease RecJ [Saccharospirillum alexandrii]|uniref:single-stranded-DNA-specific exonuclease RecJ n=1 Tax=Saccharospirillum alexandrii TaxID=2448477 RepID=UPI000FDA99DD|nr:single-stranded-DNA-specific exonuclease RecJ [Saccharospirillum alexandrii]
MAAPFPKLQARPVPDGAVVAEQPLLDRIYRSRGVRSPQELDSSLQHLLPWQTMKGIEPAVELLIKALDDRQRILVIGDYDVDGATSTALVVQILRALGAQVDYLLPNRFEYGYGLSAAIVEQALTRSPDLIITVDNGIASLDGVAAAQAAGVAVLITDHHLPGADLPPAEAIVNPNQPGCDFASKAACGCTVAFYLMIALRAELRDRGWFEQQSVQPPNLAQWLDLVALATVADVVPLDANNRRLVNQGLGRIRAGQSRPGIQALFEVAGREWQRAQASDFGFVVGPRLNAAGRLDDMAIGVRCLLTNNPGEARQLAAQLEDLNRERRAIERSMVVEAQRTLEQISDLPPRNGHVLYQADWHEGVIGILASRIKDQTHRPVIALAGSDNGRLKGSARSIPGFHLRDALDWIAKQDPELLITFGGHAMAAGLTLSEGNEGRLQHWFEQAVQTLCEPEALQPTVMTDGELSAKERDLGTALALEQAGPFGQGFPAPVFQGEFWIEQQKIVGERHLKLSLSDKEGQSIEAIAFNIDIDVWPTQNRALSGIYQLSCNRFRGRETVQLIFDAIKPLETI